MEPTAVAGGRKLRYAPHYGPFSAILAAHPAGIIWLMLFKKSRLVL